MPIYEYKCQSCHKLFEYIQKVNDALRTECEECHGKLEKLVSSTSFQLKGTGWYVTDFKNTDKNADKKTTSEEKPTQDDKKTAQETQSAPSEKEPTKKPATESTPTTKES
jgi:putative FmdB family regulatory protein